MNLYVLRPAGDFVVFSYDCQHGCVVRAENETQARAIASANAGDEGPAVWDSSAHTVCEVLAQDCEGKMGLVLQDFHAG